jgi:hypothetical protein
MVSGMAAGGAARGILFWWTDGLIETRDKVHAAKKRPEGTRGKPKLHARRLAAT